MKRSYLWVILLIGSILLSSCGDEAPAAEKSTVAEKSTAVEKSIAVEETESTITAEMQSPEESIQEPVRIAVLDSGISTTAIDPESLDRGLNHIKPLSGTEDTIGHGTAVASIIVGSETAGVEGICPQAVLVPLVYCAEDYLGRTVNADAVTIGEMIYEAVDTFECDMINISAASATDDRYLREAVEYAIEQGVIVIACAGNTNLTTPENVYYPGAYEDVICIGSVNNEGAVSDFSQRGTCLDFVAPGEEIPAAAMDGAPVAVTGTSFATAYVTGLVANILMENPDLNRTPEKAQEAVMEALKELAEDINGAGWDEAYGWGILGRKAR